MKYSLLILLFLLQCRVLPAQELPLSGSSREAAITAADSTIIHGLINRGISLVNDKTDSAKLLLSKAAAQSRSLGYNDGIALALMGLSSCFAVNNESAEALKLLDRTLPYCLSSPQRDKMLIKWHRNRFIAFKYAGFTDSALATVKQVLPLLDRVKDTSFVINTYNHIGSILIDNQDYRLAYAYITKAMHMNTRLNTDKLVSLLNLGYVYSARNDLDSMYIMATAASKGAQQLQTARYERSAALLLNKYFLFRRETTQAESYAARAIALIDPLAADNGLYVYRVLSMNYNNMQQYDKALTYGKTALGYLDSVLPARADVIELYRLLASAYRSSGNPSMAYQMLLTHNQLSDSLRAKEHDRLTRYLEKQFRLAEKEKEIALKETQLLAETGKVKNRNIWIMIVVLSIVLLAIMLVVVYRSSRRKIYILGQQKEIDELRAMIEGEEKERNRIAIELHDNIGGMLSAATYNLESLKQGSGSAAESNIFRKVDNIINEVRSEVRKTAHTLMPDVLLRHSLPEAIRQYCHFIETDTGLAIDMQAQGSFEQLNKDMQLALYRITQELIQNVLKHAKASHVMVQVHLGKGLVSLTVEDDGAGFKDTGHSDGKGLHNIERRLTVFNGKITVDSGPGKGTSVYVEIGI